MTELEVKNLINETMAGPKAPEDLVKRTIERGKAIEEGRKAEKQLSEMKKTGPDKEKTELAAKSITGHMMMSMVMPKGVTAEMITQKLVQNTRFQEVTAVSSDKVLLGIKDGSLVKEIAKQHNVKQNEKEQPVKKEPEKGLTL